MALCAMTICEFVFVFRNILFEYMPPLFMSFFIFFKPLETLYLKQNHKHVSHYSMWYAIFSSVATALKLSTSHFELYASLSPLP